MKNAMTLPEQFKVSTLPNINALRVKSTKTFILPQNTSK